MRFIFVFLILLGLTFLILPNEKDKINNFRIDKQPQEYMSQVFIQNYTTEGKLKSQMSATYWAYLPTKAASTFTDPRLISYRPDGSEWRVRSDLGKTNQPKMGSVNELELSKNVIIERPASSRFQHIKIETERMNYHLKNEYAESDVFVKMMKPGLLISGVGLRAYLKRSLVQLLDQVNTNYIATVAKPTEPISIQSNIAEFDEKNDKAVYREQVVMAQGARQIHSEILVIEKDKKGKIESMVATGDPAYFTSEVDPNNPAKGHAKIVNYFPKENKIHLFKDAELSQHNHTIQSDQFCYDLNTEVLSSEQVEGKRTTLILQPKKKVE